MREAADAPRAYPVIWQPIATRSTGEPDWLPLPRAVVMPEAVAYLVAGGTLMSRVDRKGTREVLLVMQA